MKKLSILITTVIIPTAGLTGRETNSNKKSQSKDPLLKIGNESTSQQKKL